MWSNFTKILRYTPVVKISQKQRIFLHASLRACRAWLTKYSHLLERKALKKKAVQKNETKISWTSISTPGLSSIRVLFILFIRQHEKSPVMNLKSKVNNRVKALKFVPYLNIFPHVFSHILLYSCSTKIRNNEIKATVNK